MECPVCSSKAVVARACLPDALEQLQTGLDPYDLIAGDQAEAVCKSCGHVFQPLAPDGPSETP